MAKEHIYYCKLCRIAERNKPDNAEDISCRAPAPPSVSVRQRQCYLSSSHEHKQKCLGKKQEKQVLFCCQVWFAYSIFHIPSKTDQYFVQALLAWLWITRFQAFVWIGQNQPDVSQSQIEWFAVLICSRLAGLDGCFHSMIIEEFSQACM